MGSSLRPARRRNEVFTRFFYKKIAGAGQSPAARREGAGVQRAAPFGARCGGEPANRVQKSSRRGSF